MARAEAAKAHVLPRPYVLKPVTEGSSVGVFIVREDHAHPPQELTDPAWAHGEDLLAERFIPGRELTCAVMGDRVLGVIEIVPAETLGFYNYESKYALGGSRHLLPAPLSSNVYELVQKLTLTAHKALGCRGVSRADFRFDDTPGGSGQMLLPRGQYAARHDADLAGSGARGTRRALVCRVGELDGGGGELQQIGPRPDIRWRAVRPPAPRPAFEVPAATTRSIHFLSLPSAPIAHARGDLTC